ncbi:MAG: hypothetical protein SGI88_20890 [Candidatus Hydrogenedentes bacterium]|nr:hypothetical protein [Candidatus Hydrogenedentota bacterium]
MKTRNARRVYDADNELNSDPLSGTPGAHPIGTGLGAAGGAAAGAAIGSAGGPVGAAAGLVVGGIAGGLVGKGAAEAFDPTAEAEYWRINYNTRPYVSPDANYDTYECAYRAGYEGALRYPGYSFEEAEEELRNNYEQSEGRSTLTWEKAKRAVRDAWDRVQYSLSDDRSVL